MTTASPPFLLPPLENPYVQPVVSSTGRTIYFVIVNEGEWHCTCPATVVCKHVRAVVGQRGNGSVHHEADLSRKALLEIARVPHSGDGDSRECASERGRIARRALAERPISGVTETP